MAKNIRLANIWNRQGFNLVTEVWGWNIKFKIWPPKKGDFKNGKSSPEKEMTISPQVLLDLRHIANRLLKADIGKSETYLYRQKDNATGAWNNLLLYSIKKDLTQNSAYTLVLNFCQDGSTYEFPFSRSEQCVPTSEEPTVERDSALLLLEFVESFKTESILTASSISMSSEDGSKAGGAGAPGKAFGGSYGGSSEVDIPQ